MQYRATLSSSTNLPKVRLADSNMYLVALNCDTRAIKERLKSRNYRLSQSISWHKLVSSSRDQIALVDFHKD